MYIFNDFSDEGLREANAVVGIMLEDKSVLFVNDIETAMKNIESIEFERGTMNGCLVTINLKGGIFQEIDIDAQQIITFESHTDGNDGYLEIITAGDD